MAFCKVVLLIAFGSCLASATHNYDPLRYSIPDPLIQAFRPKGLEVSIPHTSGIQLFAFHGNINKPLHASLPGQFSQDVRHADGDRWILSQPDVELQIGDKIYYWIFVIKDNLGYRYEDGEYEVTDVTFDYDNWNTTEEKVTRVPEKFDLDSKSCERALLNATKTMLNLQGKIEFFRETNFILMDLVGKHFDTATTLTLDGPLPNDEHLFMVVDGVVRDRLGLDVRVQNVARKKNGTVTFQVATLDDKIAVVRAARKKLHDSKYAILY